MAALKPVFVYSEAFLRCAPWTPVSFRVQQNHIVQFKKGEEEFLCNSVKCLEAFGILSDIDAVCAHLRRFKDSELAKRVFRNLRRFKVPEPVDLITAFNLSVGVKGNRSISFNTKKIFKGFLKAFLDLCLKLTDGNSCLEEKLKLAFIDTFEGLTPTNFILKVESSGTTNKRRNVKRWIYIVHVPQCDKKQRYDTMVQHLAFLAPTNDWGMYIEGSGYRGDYKQWILPPAFTGFELDTDCNSSRNWTAMKEAKINLIEKPALSTVEYFSDSKRSRKFLEDTRDDEEDEAPLPKIPFKINRDSQRQENFSIDVTGDITPPPSQPSLTDFDSDDLDSLGETPKGSHSETHEEKDGGDPRNAVTVPLDPQPSTSGQDEQPETAAECKECSLSSPSSSSACISSVSPKERNASCNVSDVTTENSNNSDIGHKTVTTVTSQTGVAAAQVALQPCVDPVIAEIKNEILTQLISSPEVRRAAVCFLSEVARHIANQMNDTQ